MSPSSANLKRERAALNEVEAEARLQQIDSLSNVKWAVLVTTGQISFLVEKELSERRPARGFQPLRTLGWT